jgi:hypothetical protein
MLEPEAGNRLSADKILLAAIVSGHGKRGMHGYGIAKPGSSLTRSFDVQGARTRTERSMLEGHEVSFCLSPPRLCTLRKTPPPSLSRLRFRFWKRSTSLSLCSGGCVVKDDQKEK